MIQITVPDMQNQLRPRITVFGVGGAGGNAVNNMVRANLEGVEFVVANTDSQALSQNLAERKVQLGVNLTRGLGAGAKPDVGRAAAEEQIDEINAYLEGTNMAFITAGMGGGTGTGAAPVIARTARDRGILTVGVVTKPFHFEGRHRMAMAEAGIAELQQYVDTLIIIPNQNLFRIANEKTTFADAFRLADEVLHSGVRGVTDLMVMPGLINLDFNDIRSVMSEMGKAMMGTGESMEDNRAIKAAEAAIANPLLDDVSMKGARGVLINVTGGMDMTLFEVDAAANRIREEVDPDANIIFGSTFDEKMEGKMRVSVVATGIDVAAEAPRTTSVSGGLSAVSTSRVAEPRKMEQPVQRPAAFSPGFVAPAAAQAAAARPQAQPQTYQATAQGNVGQGMGGVTGQPMQTIQTPSFSSPFSWGPQKPAVSASMSPATALEQLLERAKQAEAIAQEAEQRAQAAQTPSVQQPVQPPQQMSMPQMAAPQTSFAPAPQQQADFMQAEREKQNAKRSTSLFDRIRQFGSARNEGHTAEQPQQATQTKLGVDPADRPRLSSEEETLEIPAFLRRQSN